MRNRAVVSALLVVGMWALAARSAAGDDSYTVSPSLFGHRRQAAAAAAPALVESAGALEFELDAEGKPVPKHNASHEKRKGAHHRAHPEAHVQELSAAEKAQKQVNSFADGFEVVDQSTDKTGQHHRFAETAADAQAESELTVQQHAEVALAAELHAEAAAEESEDSLAGSDDADADASEDEADAEEFAEYDLLERTSKKHKSHAIEHSPAEKLNPNYACYRWTRPPRSGATSAATAGVPFAPREGHASWLSGNGKSLYSFGGCDRQTLPKNCYGELKQMNLTTRVWRNRKILGVIDGEKDLTLHMQGAAHAPDTRTGKRLFVFGGLRVDPTENSAFSNSLDLLYYDKTQKEWAWTHVKTTGEHPPKCQDASLLLIGDQLVLFGGYSDAGFFNDVYTIRTHPNNVLVDPKDPDLWKWKKVNIEGGAQAALPPARRGHTLSLHSTRGGSYRVYVFGGVNGVNAFNDIWVLRVPNWFAAPPEPKKGSAAARERANAKEKATKHWGWTKVVAGAAARAIPAARAHHSAIRVKPHHMLVFGGCDPFTNKCFDDVLLFNARTKTWLPTPPSLLQSALQPVVKPRATKDAKGKVVVPPPQTPKRRFPAWNFSPRKKMTVTLLPHKGRVMVLGGCDRAQCFGDVYEMDLKGVCVDSCGAHGRFVDYRAPRINARGGRRGRATKKSFIELAAEHTAAQASAALAEQLDADEVEDEDAEGDADESADESEAESEENEVVDEEDLAESQMLEEIELTAEEAAAHGAENPADDDTIDHSEAEVAAAMAASGAAFLQLMDGPTGSAPAPVAGSADTTLPGSPVISMNGRGFDPDNKPPPKLKLIRKKGHKKGKRRHRKSKPKTKIGGLLSQLSLEQLKELNKERSFDAKCMCRDGFTGKFCQKKSKCHLNCSGHKRGLCVTDGGSHYCKCNAGSWGQGCEFKVCKNNCSGHGMCTPHQVGNATASVCKCEAGFWGRDCSLAEEWRRELLEKAICPGMCSGNGRCTNNYTLSASHNPNAPEWHATNPFNLHPLNRPFDVMSVDTSKIKDPKMRASIEKRQAEARAARDAAIKAQPYKCHCRPGYGGDDCSKQCPLMCSRHGTCNATGSCQCDSGWSGAGCNVPTCGEGDLCTYHGTCDKAQSRCKCNGAFRGPACDIDTSCSGHGQWVKGTKHRRGHCRCKPGWFLEDCSLQLSCPGECSKHGRCILKGRKQRKAARAFKPLSKTATPPPVKGAPDTSPPPLPRVVAGTCVCGKGWQSQDCSQKVCPRGCMRHGECKNGVCQCYPGFTGADCGATVNCAGNCTDALHGTCHQVRDLKTKLLKPKCKCRFGWAGKDCSQLACPKDCSRAGRCLAGKCQCKPGRFGADCSVKCPNDCSGHGECQSTGRCTCDAEYSGADCSTRKSCPSKTDADCSGHGLCHVPTAKCHCEPGFSGADCSKDGSSCANKDCSAHGKCSFGKCFCQIGFSGENCEIITVCKQSCNNRGICNMGKCECNPGWAGDACDVQVWDNTCPANCNNHGLCNKGVCSCIQGWTGSDCGTISDFCKDNDCSGRGTCAYNKCSCLPGTNGPNCEHGTTCPDGCDPKQGVCLLGKCHCLPGFTGPTCSQPQICPGVTPIGACNGHGVCMSGTCACEPGYGGVDCSENMLPKTLSATACPKDCSGAGVCYMGKCFCVKGYGGVDCSIPYETRCPLDCAGHPPRYDQRGVCHLGKCLCHPGYTGESCEIEVTCPSKCSVNGVCAHGKCFCVAGWTGPACDWQLRGPLKHRTYQEELKDRASRRTCGGCSMHGMCIDNKCVCEAGYEGEQCEMVGAGPLISRCPNGCNGQGTCMFGKCFCDPGWTGAGCDKPLEMACPADCSQRGICRWGRCFCNPGAAGEDCSQAAVCDAKCGTHGVCIDGRCVCADGFSGENCDIATGRTPRKPTTATTATTTSPASFLESSASDVAELPAVGSLAELSSKATLVSAAASAPSAPNTAAAREVVVTSYPFPLAVIVAAAFVVGVMVSALAKCVIDQRSEMNRQQRLIGPLLEQQSVAVTTVQARA